MRLDLLEVMKRSSFFFFFQQNKKRKPVRSEIFPRKARRTKNTQP